MAGAAAMTSGAMETRVRQIMAVVFGRRLDGAPADAEGLWDSLEGINLLFALQEAFSVDLSDPDEWAECNTIAGVVATIERRTSSSEHVAPPGALPVAANRGAAAVSTGVPVPEGLAHRLRPALPSDVPEMAHIHAHSGTPGLLTDLGAGFLRAYYRRLISSRLGRATVLDISGEVAGFVTASPDSTRLFEQIFGGRHVAGTALAVALASIRHPRTARSVLETVRSVRGTGSGTARHAALAARGGRCVAKEAGFRRGPWRRRGREHSPHLGQPV